MKKWVRLLAILVGVTWILAACGNKEETYEPAGINPDTDVCEVCAMAVADDQHATQIVLKNHRSLKFDDLGCLYSWLEDHGEEDVGAAFVRDFYTQEWIKLEDAAYVFGDEIHTPMSYGIISFKDVGDAEGYIEEHGHGELLTAADLEHHKWEMMNHHHDHGHSDGHHHQ